MILKFNTKKTKLCENLNIHNAKRFMETNRVLTEEEKTDVLFTYRNLLREQKEDLLLKQYADEATTYILESLNESCKFSEIIRASKENLGYVMSVDSFVTFFDILLSHAAYEKAAKFYITCADDINLYDPLRFTLTATYRDHYNMYAILQITSETVMDSSLHDSASSALFNNNNNNVIILYTVIAFSIIIITAWYFNKKNQEQVVDSMTLTDEKSTLHSINEFTYDYIFIFKTLLLLFIPQLFLHMYHFRYYLLYQNQSNIKKTKHE